MRPLLTALLLAISSLGFAQISYNVGDPVNDFSVTTLTGETFQLSSATSSGQYVVLHFAGDWNPWDVAVAPDINATFEAFGCGTGDVAFIGLNYSNNGDISTQTFVDENNYLLPIASFAGGSEAVIADFGVNAFPSFVLVGPDQTLVDPDMYGGPEGTFDEISGTLASLGIGTSPCVAPVQGCTDPLAWNYNPLAQEDDGSCSMPTCELAATVDWANQEFGLHPAQGAGETGTVLDLDFVLNPGTIYTDPLSGNVYDVISVEPTSFLNIPAGLTLTPNPGTLIASGDYGCFSLQGIPPAAGEYNISCLADVTFSLLGSEIVFNTLLTYTLTIVAGPDLEGCTYIGADNYNLAATIEDGSCIFSGCTNALALNYNPIATVDDASCLFADLLCGQGCFWDPVALQCLTTGCADINGDGSVDAQDVLALIGQYGGSCE